MVEEQPVRRRSPAEGRAGLHFYGLLRINRILRRKKSKGERKSKGGIWRCFNRRERAEHKQSLQPRQQQPEASLIHAGFSHFESLQRHLPE